MSAGSKAGTRALAEAGAWLALVAIDAEGSIGWQAASVHRPAEIHPAEWLEAEVLTDPARRRQWLAGRRAAKAALASVLGEDAFEAAAHVVRSRDRFGRPARPTVWRGGRRVPVYLSVAHGERVAAAIASLDHRVGVDVVDHERDLRHGVGKEAWLFSAREAAYKVGALATREEPFRPDDWRVERDPAHELGRVRHDRLGARALPVRWLCGVPGAPVLAVSWSPDERSAA